MRSLSETEKTEIAQAYAQGVPVKVIAAEHDLHLSRPTAIAKKLGVPLRVKHSGRGQIKAAIGKALKERLRMAAKRQRTTPDVIVREALAAYLGGPSL